MSGQPVTSELRQWIVDQALAGCEPAAVLKAMLASGWRSDVAQDALQQTLGAPAVDPSGALLEGMTVAARAQALPEPLPDVVSATLWAGDRHVQVLAALRHPRIIVFGGLLSDGECDELIALARPALARSETVQLDTGASEVNEARTSQGMFFDRGQYAVCARVEARMAALLHWPLENGEGLQVLRYGPGAEYRPHFDYFDPEQSGTPLILQRGGQRVASLVCYLNTVARGGATVFPDLPLEVAPIKGNAVFFSYDRPHPSTRTLHGGALVLEGEKWVATKWLRQGRFD